MKILINESDKRELEKFGMYDENKYIVAKYIENIEECEFGEVTYE